MMRNYLLFLALLLSSFGWSQTTNVQIIHNSPDPAAASVDVYVNGILTLNDFDFRAATSYLPVLANVELTIGIAPSTSTGSGDVIANFGPVTLSDQIDYVIIVSGVVNPADFDASVNPGELALSLDVLTQAQMAASMPGMVDFAVSHGSPDAPAVDVVVGGAPLVSDVSFTEWAETGAYFSVPAGKYILNITPAGQNDVIVASFLADLSGLGGGAAAVFASGFLDPAANQDGAGFGLFAALPDGTVVEFPAVGAPNIVINEVDYDQADTDTGEFIELKNNGTEAASLFGTSIDLWNGSNDEVYDNIELPDVMVEAGAYYVVCFGENNAAYCDIVVEGAIQNGGPDAISLAFQGQTIDALSYEGSVADVVEESADGLEDISSVEGGGIARFPDGADSDNNDADFRFGCITPGTSNESADFSCITTNANVQVIHNSPSSGTEAGPVVDIYVNGLLLPELTGVPFRAATPFLPLPAGVDVEVAVAVNPSNSVADAIATFPLGQLAENENYVVIANGIVGNAETPFNLEVNVGKTAADDAGTVEFSAFHGSPDAPSVDVDARAVATLASDLAFGTFTPYVAVPPSLYYLDVRAAGDPNIVATFAADLSGLAGGAATVFASGLLGDTPSFGLFAALPDGTVVEFPAASVARVQVIHNSPSPTVDIYANDDLLINDFAFRTATPFIFLPADVMINVGVALDNSMSSMDAIANFDAQFENGRTYVITANGIVGDMDTPFTLDINDMGQERSGSDAVAISVLHGSPGAPGVDVDARLVGTLFSDVTFGEYNGYLDVPADIYYLDIRPTADPTVLATFEADVSELAGTAITVFASGILGAEPAFGLFAALPDGTVVELPATGAARAQIIHNSPSGTVDVYVNGELAIDNFEFLTATPFGWIRADVPVDIAIAGPESTSVDDAIATFDGLVFEDRSTVVVVAAGEVANGTFDLFTSEGQEAGASNDAFDALVFHGSPDAPAIDVDDFGAGEIISNISFGEFTDGYLPLGPFGHVFDIRATGTSDVVSQFFFNLTGGNGLAGVVFAGGFLGEGEPPLNLYVALPDGTVIPAIPVAIAQFIHNSATPGAETVDIYANEALFIDDLTYRGATPYVFVPSRVELEIGVALGNSTGPDDILFTLPDPLVFSDASVSNVVAAGLAADPTTPFELFTFDNARLGAATAGTVDVAIFHGATDAPGVDIDARGIGNVLMDFQYGDFTPDYLPLPGGTYFIEVRPAGVDDLVGTFSIDASPFLGASAMVFASGFLGDDPAFGLFAALPDGTVVELTPVSQLQVIHNSPSPTVDVYANGALFLDDFTFRSATPFVDLPTRVPIDLAVAPENSSSAADAIANFDGIVLEDGKVYIVMATGVVGDPDTPFDLNIFDEGRTSSAGDVDLLLYHGSPDAPEVDVVAQGVGVIFDNVEYGEYDGYLNVPAAEYVLDVTPSNDNDVIVKRYSADVTGLDGGAATVFASGFLGSADEDAFQVWVALADGTTFPLEELVAVNDLTDEVSSFMIVPNPAKEQTEVQYTLTDALDVTLNVYDATGRLVNAQYVGKQVAGAYNYTIDLRDLAAGVYNYSIVTPKGIMTKRFTVVK